MSPMQPPGPPPRDEQWLEQLVRDHQVALRAYARRRVEQPADADDVVAEVFAAAWRHRERVSEPALPWLDRTASHHVLHVYRGTGRRGRLHARLATTAGSDAVAPDHADSVSAALDDAAVVRAGLARLSPSDAEVLRLAAWEQLDIAGIAYVLGCSHTAAKVRLHRARRRLAAVLGPEPQEPAAVRLLAPLPEEVHP